MPADDRAGRIPLAIGLLLFVPMALLGNVIGSSLRYPDIGAAVLFPPYAVLAAVLIVSQRRDWIWYLIAGAFSHFVTHWPQWSLSWVMFAEVANIARAITAAVLVRWCLGRSLRLDSMRALWLFLVSAGLVAPAAGATIGAASVVWHGGSATYWRPWLGWFVSNGLTGLAMLPAAIAAFEHVASWRRILLPPARAIEATLLALALTATCAVAFVEGGRQSLLALPVYAPLPVLIWAALRFGSGGASLALTAVTFSAIWSADRGAGPFAASRLDESILALQIFVVFAATLVLCLSTIATSRRLAQAEVDEHRRALAPGACVGARPALRRVRPRAEPAAGRHSRQRRSGPASAAAPSSGSRRSGRHPAGHREQRTACRRRDSTAARAVQAR
jgi:integral membrane sensor domain MASE1